MDGLITSSNLVELGREEEEEEEKRGGGRFGSAAGESRCSFILLVVEIIAEAFAETRKSGTYL